MKDRNSPARRLPVMALIAVFAVSWGSFVFTPVTGDLKVFLASAHQATYISKNLILGAFRSWELKSVVSRVLMYLIYKTARVFAPYNSYAFEVVSKAIYSLMLLLTVFAAMRLVFDRNRRKTLIGTAVAASLLMGTHTSCHMQVEMTATLFVLLAFALYLDAVRHETRRTLKLLSAGVLIGLVFYLKSVLILLSVSVVAAVCIYALENRIPLSFGRMMVVVAGSFAALAAVGVLILLIYPAEFRDILDASAFQSTAFSTTQSLRSMAETFLDNHLYRPLFIPAMLLGLFCLLGNLYRAVRGKNWALLFFHLAMWSMPALFVLLSNRYFSYHFAAYLFPSLAELYFFAERRSRSGRVILAAAAVMTAAWYIALFSLLSVNVRTYLAMDLQAYEQSSAFLSGIDYDTEAVVLYLDSGYGGYVLGNPSCLKYFFPLPLQRLPEDSTLACHADCLNKAYAFDGRYVSVEEDWFFGAGRYPGLKEKITNEYRHLGTYYVFFPPQTLGTAGIASRMKAIELYERTAPA